MLMFEKIEREGDNTYHWYDIIIDNKVIIR